MSGLFMRFHTATGGADCNPTPSTLNPSTLNPYGEHELHVHSCENLSLRLHKALGFRALGFIAPGHRSKESSMFLPLLESLR